MRGVQRELRSAGKKAYYTIPHQCHLPRIAWRTGFWRPGSRWPWRTSRTARCSPSRWRWRPCAARTGRRTLSSGCTTRSCRRPWASASVPGAAGTPRPASASPWWTTVAHPASRTDPLMSHSHSCNNNPQTLNIIKSTSQHVCDNTRQQLWWQINSKNTSLFSLKGNSRCEDISLPCTTCTWLPNVIKM